MLFAEVAVDTYQDPRKKLFTYQIPGKLAKKVKPGVEVVVPFGKRTAQGYVWQVSRDKPKFPTKPVQTVKAQTFSDSQIQLARWMAEHYLGSPLECLKCQQGKRGEQEQTAPPSQINTLVLLPYASGVKIRALKAKKAGEEALIGSRSAVFAQLPRLKRIVVEEPESWNYKDERAPYYHAAEIAQKRGEIEGIEVELRPLVPRVETFAAGSRDRPELGPIRAVDLGLEKSAGNFTFVSQELEQALKKGGKLIIYASSRILKDSVEEEALRTGADRNFFEVFGPELLSMPGKEAEELFWADGDTLLNLPDFRAHEKMAATASRLSRMAGSGLAIQTATPNHPLIRDLTAGDLTGFYQRERKNRKELGYPPFSTLVKLTYASKSPAKTSREAEKLFAALSSLLPDVSPPYEPYARTPGKSALHLAVRIKKGSQSEESLVKLAEAVPPAWRTEVDPESLL